MAFDQSNRFFKELLARIVQDSGAIIPFVGAGLSHYGRGGDKLPLWRELVDRMQAFATDLGVLSNGASEKVKSLVSQGLYIAATDLIVDAIGPTLFRTFVRSELDVKGKPLSPAALSLVVIAWSIIVTTNLDETLEAAYQAKHNKRPSVITHRQISELIEAINNPQARDTITLAKIHGTLDDFASWCLTEKHYQRLIASPAYNEILRSLFLKRLFFIGFGLSDKDFDLVQEYLEKIFPDGDTESYALIPRNLSGNPRLVYLINRRGLKPIFYNVVAGDDANDPWGGHGEIYECLAAIAQVWLSSYGSTHVHMQNFPELEPTFTGRVDELLQLDHIIFRRNRSAQVVGFGGEGKTTLIQEWVRSRTGEFKKADFDYVFGFSFYSGSPDRFINDCFLALSPHKTGWDVSRQLRFICEEAARRRIVFVLDGAEALLDDSGALVNPYIQEFVESVERTDSRIVFTSRIELPGPFVILQVKPLSDGDIDGLLQSWDRADMHPSEVESIKRRSRGHALSVRMSLGMKESAVEGEPPWEQQASSGPLAANKLERTLRYYDGIISPAERAFLTCFSIFERPTRFDFIERLFRHAIPSFELNAPLRDVDLRSVVKSLLKKRLLIASDGTRITEHPNVRDYFRKCDADLSPLHAAVVRLLLADRGNTVVSTLREAESFIDICHHGADAGLWTEFHHAYKTVLMRGYADYLCDTLGAWSEALDTAIRAFPYRDPRATPAIFPDYYCAQYARCLKHLGFAQKAIEAYPRALRQCAQTEAGDSAQYMNNFLTLQIYAGNIQSAKRMAGWNAALLNWIGHDWIRRWQVEHGGYSISWLTLVLGDLSTAQKLFELAEGAWVGCEADRVEIFDHFPLYAVELYLNKRISEVPRAESIILKYLDAGLRNGWPETIIRAHIARSTLERYLAGCEAGDPRMLHVRLARQACAKAVEAAKSIFAPPVAVELLIEELKVELTLNASGLCDQEVTERLDRLGKAIQSLGWKLYEPEYLALCGLRAEQQGDLQTATRLLHDAEASALAIGNRLPHCSILQSLHVLRNRLRLGSEFTFAALDGTCAELAEIDFLRPTGTHLEAAIADEFRTSPTRPERSIAKGAGLDH